MLYKIRKNIRYIPNHFFQLKTIAYKTYTMYRFTLQRFKDTPSEAYFARLSYGR